MSRRKEPELTLDQIKTEASAACELLMRRMEELGIAPQWVARRRREIEWMLERRWKAISVQREKIKK